MAEFLKNNPIALHHCLLYHFLQKKSVIKAFTDFRTTVGDDVINEEEFEFKMDKFKQGKVDDNNEKIDKIVDILRNDKKALRICVLYEWLDTKRQRLLEMKRTIYYKNYGFSVFARYKNFCKVIGDNVMEYREFDFWYYRFFNGEFDLNYEKDKDKKILELTDMPIVVMRNIVEYLNIFNRLALARTSRSFEKFVENQKLFHQKLTLQVFANAAYIAGIGDNKIFYDKRKKGVPKWKRAIQDFKGILNYPKHHLNTLEIGFNTKRQGLKTKMPDEFIKSSTSQVNAKNLIFKAYSMEALLKILPLFTPGYLTEIDISVQKMNSFLMNKVAELEQWKQAKKLSMGGDCPNVPMRHLCHFEELYICCDELSAENIREMKEVLFTSPVLEKCTFEIKEDLIENSIIREEFDDPIPKKRDTFHYPIPNSKEYFEIYATEWIFKATRKRK